MASLDICFWVNDLATLDGRGDEAATFLDGTGGMCLVTPLIVFFVSSW
jgi:hypothetical protein